MVFAGQLTENLDIYSVTETQSASGFKTKTETLVCSCRAERLKNRNNYIVDAGELYHSSELTFRLRYRDVITDTCIVVYNGDRYRITSIDEFSDDNEMAIIMSKINE